MIARFLRWCGWVPRWELDAQVEWAKLLHSEREYWRRRAEQLMDAALGLPPPQRPTASPRVNNPLMDIMRAMSISEVESTTRKEPPAAT